MDQKKLEIMDKAEKDIYDSLKICSQKLIEMVDNGQVTPQKANMLIKTMHLGVTSLNVAQMVRQEVADGR